MIVFIDSEEESRQLTSQEVDERALLKTQLDTILKQEEMLWKQRARVQWLLDGDCNTKFFHIRVSNLRRKNIIMELLQGEQKLP